MKKLRCAAAVILAGLTMGATDLGAQEQAGCLRGQRLPQCKTFWIIEIQGLVPVAQTSRVVTTSSDHAFSYEAHAFDYAVEWNLGHMVNVGEGYGVGGVFTVGSGNADPLTGIRARGRKWLAKNLSIEVEGGLLRSDAAGSRGESLNGWTAGARLNIRDQGSFFLRYDRLNVPKQTRPIPNDGYSDPGGSHHGLSVGANAGSVPALLGTGALGAFLLVLSALTSYD